MPVGDSILYRRGGGLPAVSGPRVKLFLETTPSAAGHVRGVAALPPPGHVQVPLGNSILYRRGDGMYTVSGPKKQMGQAVSETTPWHTPAPGHVRFRNNLNEPAHSLQTQNLQGARPGCNAT